MPDQPTLGDLARRLQDLADQGKALADRLDRDREAHQRSYMPRELYAAMHTADNAVVADLARDIRACRDSVNAEVKRVETKLETFNAEYDRDRREDAKAREAEQQAEKTRHAEDDRAEKGRRQQWTLTISGLVLTALLSVIGLTLSLLTYVR